MNSNKNVAFVIMAGGIGERLRPYTYALPKPLLTANGISPLENIFKNIRLFGKNEKIFLSLGYKKEVFKKWIKTKKIKNLKFIFEKEPLGTAGGLKKLINSKFKNLIVVNGDLFFKVNFRNILKNHEKNKNYFTVCVKNHALSIPYAILEKKRTKIWFKEKPKIAKQINTGIYVIEKKFLKDFFSNNKNKKRSKFDMPEIINSVKKGKVGVFDIGKKWIDIGNIYDFKKASKEIQFW